MRTNHAHATVAHAATSGNARCEPGPDSVAPDRASPTGPTLLAL